jgi:hypothetical protein
MRSNTCADSPTLGEDSGRSSRTPLEIDLENGKADGSAIIRSRSTSAAQAKVELTKYWHRLNPSLSNAKELYTASLCEHPNIPKTVLTKSIATILSKKFKTVTTPENDDASSPASSLTGATSKSSTIAWKTPLQETLQTTIKKKPMTSNEINQLKRIAILEAQVAINHNPDPLDRGNRQRHLVRHPNCPTSLLSQRQQHTVASTRWKTPCTIYYAVY